MCTGGREETWSDLLATDETFVERAIGAGSIPTVSPGLLDAAGMRALRRRYSESGQAPVDPMQSAIDEGRHAIGIERLRELGIVEAGESDRAAG